MIRTYKLTFFELVKKIILYETTFTYMESTASIYYVMSEWLHAFHKGKLLHSSGTLLPPFDFYIYEIHGFNILCHE